MANCELSAARLRANVALRSPLSEPLAILAACLRSKVSKATAWEVQEAEGETTAADHGQRGARAAATAGEQRRHHRQDQHMCGAPLQGSLRGAARSTRRSTPNKRGLALPAWPSSSALRFCSENMCRWHNGLAALGPRLGLAQPSCCTRAWGANSRSIERATAVCLPRKVTLAPCPVGAGVACCGAAGELWGASTCPP